MPELRVAFFGGEGVGKSTIIGHLVYQLGDQKWIKTEEKTHEEVTMETETWPRLFDFQVI